MSEDFPTLGTARLLLREITAADAPVLLEIHGNAQAMRWSGTDPLADLAQAETLVETFAEWRLKPAPGVRWGIERHGDRTLIGTCGLSQWNREWKCCIVGFELAPAAWGAGFMQEALQAALTWGFVQMGLNRIAAQVHPQNEASLRLVRKLGFVQEGHLREAGFWQGEHHDLLAFGLLRREHRPPSARPRASAG